LVYFISFNVFLSRFLFFTLPLGITKYSNRIWRWCFPSLKTNSIINHILGDQFNDAVIYIKPSRPALLKVTNIRLLKLAVSTTRLSRLSTVIVSFLWEVHANYELNIQMCTLQLLPPDRRHQSFIGELTQHPVSCALHKDVWRGTAFKSTWPSPITAHQIGKRSRGRNNHSSVQRSTNNVAKKSNQNDANLDPIPNQVLIPQL